MSDLFISELLILILLLPVVLRSVFIRSHRIDSTTLLAPTAFALCIIVWFAFGISLSVFIVSLLTFIILVSNFRALIRYCGRLFVDYYSVKFKIAMIIEGLASVVMIVALVCFPPVPVQKHTVRVFSGTSARGFTETHNICENSNLYLTIFEAEESNAVSSKSSFVKPVILYIPPVYSSAYDVSPRLEAIASQGYTVVCAELYTNTVQYFGNFFDNKIIRPWAMRIFKPTIDNTKEREVQQKAIMQLVVLLYGETYYYEPAITEPTPLMGDVYLTQPFELWLSNRDGYKKMQLQAEKVPNLIVQDLSSRFAVKK